MSSHNLADGKAATGRKMFLLLALVFILPFTIAYTLHLLDIRPSGKSFGNLISPIIELEVPAFVDANGNTFSASQWNKIWNIVMVDAAGCDAVCEQNVDTLNRVHRSLNKEKGRVQRILILKNDFDAAHVQELQEKYPKLIVLPVKGEDQQQFVGKFDQAAPNGSVYLVDPLNNLMMHYPQAVEPKALRADIIRLLKNSWGG